ncbi:MAG TPA: lasso peptide biosynthesis PqqD family chaperone [Solirubrobacteraceae bacterium]
MSIRLQTNIVVTDTEYGSVLLDERGGSYWNLNPTGALVLRALLGGQTQEQAARALADEYRLDQRDAATDVAELISALSTAGLITS